MRLRIGVLIALPLALLAQNQPMNTPGAKLPERLRASDWTAIKSEYENNRHNATTVKGGFEARNDEQKWTAKFDTRGFLVQPDRGGWNWGLELKSYGWAGQEQPVAGPARATAAKQRVAYSWDRRLEEWWMNDPRGLEHGYTLRDRPAGDGQQLILHLGIRGGLNVVGQKDGQALSFVDNNGQSEITYRGLVATDADGRTLAARMSAEGTGMAMIVDAKDARYPVTIDPWALQTELTASDGGTSNYFGSTVAADGNFAVVGADWKNTQSGEAYVFMFDGTNWNQQQILLPSDPSNFSYFGVSVAISGNTIVVGAFQKDLHGAAYVFVYDGTTWTQQQKLSPADGAPNDHFGGSVAVRGNTVVVGASWKNFSFANPSVGKKGVAYVFQRTGSTWLFQQELTSSDSADGDLFGYALALTEDAGTIFVGAPFKLNNTGAVYVFTTDGVTWTQAQKLTASDASPVTNFGDAVAQAGDVLVIGSDGGGSGSAYLFARSSTGWVEKKKLVAPDAVYQGFFGWSVAVDGNTVVVGSPHNITMIGSAYVFTRSGNNWKLQQELSAADGAIANFYGWAVAITGKTAFIGAFGNNNNTGAVYVYDGTGN